MKEEQNSQNQKTTFLGMWQRPVMGSSYVGWSKVKLLVIKKLIRLIVLGGLTLRDIFHKVSIVLNL